MELAGKRALVPGAARGVGRAIARALAREGARLALPWFDWTESVAELEAEFAADGHLPMQADLRREAEVAAVFARIREAWGGLDILVNNIERGGMPCPRMRASGGACEGEATKIVVTSCRRRW